MERMQARFRAADTQVLGVSIDSVHSHANWAKDLGGISFPLVADFQPKGALAQAVGHYLAEPGITDRATVIIDKEGVVRHSVSVGPGGVRDIAELAAECEKINGSGGGSALPVALGIPQGTSLFVKSQCGASRKVLLAVDNLHLRDAITIRNVTEDSAAMADLAKTGNTQAPCLMLGGEPMFEASAIAQALADRAAPTP